ncbi:MAG TPA: aspartate aminotransferase family protein [Stellaceae bacterium]
MPIVLPSYARAPVSFERGEGPYLFSADGRKYLDFTSGVAVVSLGHANPRLIKALTDQAQRLWHCSNLFEVEGQKRVAQKLIDHSFADTVFFCNSGTEAVEAAVKVARKYQAASGHPEKYRVIACGGSFHGRTMAMLAAAGNEKYLAGFGPPAEGYDHVAFGNLNEMRAAVTAETAAVLVEPVQGEGGLTTPPEGYLKGLRQLCDEFGLMLIYDEVQSGMGRTGKLFAHQWEAGAEPDVLATAKALGGGFPVGACLATEKAAAGMVAGTHGSTFGGNPLAMAVAEEVIDIMTEPGFFDHVNRMGRAFRTKLDRLVKAHPTIFAETRGRGLLIGLKCVVPNTEMVTRLRAAGLLAVGAGENVLRLMPPLNITEAQLDDGVAIIDAVARDWGHAPH